MHHVKTRRHTEKFSVWRRDFFVLSDVHLQHVYLQEGSLPGVLRLKKTLRICRPDHIFSSAYKQWQI